MFYNLNMKHNFLMNFTVFVVFNLLKIRQKNKTFYFRGTMLALNYANNMIRNFSLKYIFVLIEMAGNCACK